MAKSASMRATYRCPLAARLIAEVDVLRWLLLEPEAVVLGRVLEEVRRVLEHVLVGGAGGDGWERGVFLGLGRGLRRGELMLVDGILLRLVVLVLRVGLVLLLVVEVDEDGGAFLGGGSAGLIRQRRLERLVQLVGESLLAEELVEFIGRLVLSSS